MNRKTPHNTGFASGGVKCKLGALCFYLSLVQVDSFVVAQTFVLRMTICGKNRQLLVAAKRYLQV
jgi:hypothetical protein